MGFMKAMKGSNNVWGQIISPYGVGTIGPENFLNNTDHKLMITIGTKTTVFSKNDVYSIKIIDSTSHWIKYLITLKNGKRYVAIFMVISPADEPGRSKLTASPTGMKVNTAIKNFEWWMFDLIYSNENVANSENVLYQSQPIQQEEVVKAGGAESSDIKVENSEISEPIKNTNSQSNRFTATRTNNGVQSEPINNTTRSVAGVSNLGYSLKGSNNKSSSTEKKANYWTCSKCGSKNNLNSRFCIDCGTYKTSAPLKNYFDE